jgi:2-phospho-L-lactate/phosphoenolpyruvate guanylyltransferase
MTLWAVVPVKPLRRGKSRLAGLLSEDQRTKLNQEMLAHTLKILRAVPEIEQTLVISRDPAALALAREHGARTVREEGAPRLNLALRRATLFAKTYVTRGVLIVPMDLPLMTPSDIDTMVDKSHGNDPVIVIAPDRHRQGTNALLVSPAGQIEYEFGPGSFQRHCDLAQMSGARLEICELPNLALDVDYPEDLQMARNALASLRIDTWGESTILKPRRTGGLLMEAL